MGEGLGGGERSTAIQLMGSDQRDLVLGVAADSILVIICVTMFLTSHLLLIAIWQGFEKWHISECRALDIPSLFAEKAQKHRVS